jgi:hypothetical protein
MKIKDIILTEADIGADPGKLDGSQVSSLKGAVSFPDISNNKSNGSAYSQSRFYLALAGAHSDPNKSEKMPPAGAMAGDPLGLTYTDEEASMIQNAADMVGAGRITPVGNKRSEEQPSTHRVSPVRVRAKK